MRNIFYELAQKIQRRLGFGRRKAERGEVLPKEEYKEQPEDEEMNRLLIKAEEKPKENETEKREEDYKFTPKVGQEVVIGRNLGPKSGHKRNEYYQGGDIRETPLGSKGKIVRIYGKEDILLEFADKKYGSGGYWHVHLDEIKPSQKSLEEIRAQEARLGSLLEGALLQDEQVLMKDDRNGRNPFTPKFNAKDEFPAWVRQEFPELKKYAKTGENYTPLVERIGEVKEASEKAWADLSEIASDKDGRGNGRTRLCHLNFLGPRFDALTNAGENYALALETLTRALEVSNTESFPYNDPEALMREEQ